MLVFNYTCIGHGHIQSNKACQDASFCEENDHLSIAIVSDGHGGHLHPRSAMGAQFAVEAAKILIGKGVKNVIITLGTLGAIAVNKDSYEYVQAYKVDAIDTTAAGDTFVGVTTSFLAKGYSIKEALNYANLAASKTVQRPGAQQSIPYLKEIINSEKESND
jgi:sugar/nucleoside kinase (ribokinase family)